MAEKPTSNSLDLKRRQLLKFAGATAAVGGRGLHVGLASAAEPVAAAHGDDAGILDVAIIGAGMAGLTAARDLLNAGCRSFQVLEARERVGGRVLNYDLGSGYISEVGGQWIGPGQTAVADLARELQVDTFPTYYQGKTEVLGGEGRLEIDLQGTFGTDERIGAKLSELSRLVPSGKPWASSKVSELDKLSAGDWLAQQDIKPEDRSGWDTSFMLTCGVAPAKMSLLHFLSMINSASCDYMKLDSIKDSAQGTRFVGGSQILCTRMAEQLGDRLRLACPVRAQPGTLRARAAGRARGAAACLAGTQPCAQDSDGLQAAVLAREGPERPHHAGQGATAMGLGQLPTQRRNRRDQRLRRQCHAALRPPGRAAGADGNLRPLIG